MVLDLSSLRRAVGSLELSTRVALEAADDPNLSEAQLITIRAGVIQHFEFTYELCWKFMKRWLKEVAGRNDVDGIARRELFRIAAQEKLIDDPVCWFDMHTARNRSTHVYNEAIASEVLSFALVFAPEASSLLTRLEQRND